MKFSIPVFEYPGNFDLPHHYPSMNQSLEWSNALYETGFFGIDVLGDKLFSPQASNGRKIMNFGFKYILSLGFSYYGSELPIPLGVWGHEEFHRSVLGVNSVSSSNGNWLLNRWDGTVYGVTDETLASLKTNNPDALLYAYVAGVHYENSLNEKVSLDGFYNRRTMPRAALLLYNSWYVYNYFRFSTSSASDSVKVLAPPDESRIDSERDFAGADLTAWVYDMFNPEVPYTARDQFPGGEGVNRRIGFSDLSEEEQQYLENQKKLSLLNFLNPSIFFIPQIRVNEDLSFNFFTQYWPVHFGNAIGAYFPVRYKEMKFLLDIQRYSNNTDHGTGAGIGIFDLGFINKVKWNMKLNVWNQPESFYNNSRITGGNISLEPSFSISNRMAIYSSVSWKTRGWYRGDPYLDSRASLRFGLNYELR